MPKISSVEFKPIKKRNIYHFFPPDPFQEIIAISVYIHKSSKKG